MRLFLYELVSAGGLGREAPASLRAEGWAMLSALAADFTKVPGLEVATLVEENTPGTLGHRCRRIAPEQESAAFAESLAGADAVLVIAPETGGLLEDRNARVLEAGQLLLGCRPASVRLTADQLALAEYWHKHRVPTPITRLVRTAADATRLLLGRGNGDFGSKDVVLKPQHGAGSQGTILIRSAGERSEAEWDAFWSAARAEGPGDDFLVQPYIPGLAASVTLLMGPRTCVPLPAGQQVLSSDGRLRYQGGCMPLAEPLAGRAQRLTRRALEELPGLAGLVGVDLILGEADDGSLDYAIEVNPRVTTSYLGLRRLCTGNLAEAIVESCLGRDVALSWRPGKVEFCVSH
jgi:predicted ATP-grasp superfamily ATP-dependent carboligase